MPTGNNVNEDLIRERRKCTFDIQELTHIIDGGAKKTSERKEIGKLLNNMASN